MFSSLLWIVSQLYTLTTVLNDNIKAFFWTKELTQFILVDVIVTTVVEKNKIVAQYSSHLAHSHKVQNGCF